MNIIYCYDAYCHWCFGFSSVIKKIERKFKGIFVFDVLSGGMVLPKTPVHIRAIAQHSIETCKSVESMSGVTFGSDYLWHINNAWDSDWYPNSEKPAIALCIYKEFWPDSQVSFATDLQFALYVEGRDLCDDEAYRHLLPKYSIPEKDFYEKLHSEEYRNKAYDEFEIVKRLRITGFPTVLLQITESKFHMITNGYTDYETIEGRIKAISESNNS